MRRLVRVASCEKGKTCPRLTTIILLNCFVNIAIILAGSNLYAADPFLAGGAQSTLRETPKAYLSQNDFYIPYRLNDESDASSPLNLYVSKDRGQTWELSSFSSSQVFSGMVPLLK